MVFDLLTEILLVYKKKDISNRNKQENYIISFLDYKTHKNFSEACNIK